MLGELEIVGDDGRQRGDRLVDRLLVQLEGRRIPLVELLGVAPYRGVAVGPDVLDDFRNGGGYVRGGPLRLRRGLLEIGRGHSHHFPFLCCRDDPDSDC
jgi:hypothetical protein